MGFLYVGCFVTVNSFLCIFGSFSKWGVLRGFLLGVVVFIFSIVFSLRDGFLLSTDYINYVDMFNGFPEEFGAAAVRRVEPFFGGSIYFFRWMGVAPEFFLALIALVFHFFMGVFASRFSKYSILFFLMMTVTSFYFNFSSNTVRQGLALSFFIVGLSSRLRFQAIIFYALALLTHYSSVFLIIYLVSFNLFPFFRRGLFALLFLLSSLVFFVVDVGGVFAFFGEKVSGFELFNKAAINFIEGDVLVTGRVFYIFSFVAVFFAAVFNSRIIRFISSGEDFNLFIYDRIFFIVMCSVVLYPIFSQYAFFVRVISYGFFLAPLLYGVLFFSFLEKRAAILVGVGFYIFLSFALFFQMNYFL